MGGGGGRVGGWVDGGGGRVGGWVVGVGGLGGGGVLTIFWVTGRLGPFDPPFFNLCRILTSTFGVGCRILTPLFSSIVEFSM